VFGLSLGKILFTLLVIVAVWKGFRLLGRLQAQRAQAAARSRQAPSRRAGSPPSAEGRALELAPCPLCGTYVPVGTRCESVDRCRRRRPAADGRGGAA